MNSFFRHVGCVLVLISTSSHAIDFEDGDARRAINDIRQRMETMRQSQISGDQNIQKSVDKAIQQQQQQIQQLQRGSTQELGLMRQALLQLQTQIDELKQEMSTLRGEREQLTQDISVLKRSQQETLTSIDAKIKSAEERMKSIDQRFDKLQPLTVQLDGLEFEADPLEKKDFDAALAVFRKGEFSAAATSFSNFLRKYPSSGYLPSASFWLGSAKYVTREYAEAANQLRAFIAAHPQHVRAPEAMLTLANAQLEIKQTKEARKTLEDLIRLFPEGEPANAAKERLARLK